MNTPTLFIILPLILSSGLLALRRRPVLAAGLGGGLGLLLALLAWRLPIDQPISIFSLTLYINPSLDILGRKLVLDGGDARFLLFMYLSTGLWLLASPAAGVPRGFSGLALAVTALLTSALAVQPFLYAALLLELAALTSLPLLAPPGRAPGRAVMRFIIFQTLAVPFILLAGWAAGRIETGQIGLQNLSLAVACLGFGFAFWLAIFPFHAWAPMLAGEAHPYAAGFLLNMLASSVLLLLAGYINGFAWLRSYPLLGQGLLLLGVLMTVTSGLWAAFENNPGRLMGLVVLLENGLALAALGLNSTGGYELFTLQFGPRLLGTGLWALALSILQTKNLNILTLDTLGAAARRAPFAAAGLVLAVFSSAGLPLLAGFTVRQPLYLALGALSLPETALALAGTLGFWLAAYRLLTAVATGGQGGWRVEEHWTQIVFLSGGLAAVVLTGLFPRLVIGGLVEILKAFEKLG